MKKLLKCFMASFLLTSTFTAFAKDSGKKEVQIEFTKPYEYRVIANDIKGVGSPYQSGDYVIFTAETGPRYIGITFDFEDYKTIHSFMKKNITDLDDEVTDSYYFYILDIPQGVESISYRIIIDGIWTKDPTNSQSYYDPYTGIEVSTIAVDNLHKNETKNSKDGCHFIYQGPSGQHIRLAGTFTNWDSSIYELTETRPGYYELYLPLPAGTYYYAYYNGTKIFPDASNPDRAWSTEGRETSIIVVK